ncbi:MAG: type II toxin-antitoxin system VapC family toxin [Dehalococcoidia bacterium]|nr:type II toxin-antitoxin system VapC family toxin [Dehalococcoidia bacterium]
MVDQVVDSNVWLAYFLPQDALRQPAQQFPSEFQAGQHICHLPSLVLIETCGQIAHQSQVCPILKVGLAHRSFLAWEQAGLIRWYDLDSNRLSRALDTSVQLRLKGLDAVIVSLAQELSLPLRTFDMEIQQRYPNATT